MTNVPGLRPIREVVGVFNHAEDFQDTIDELLSAGFDRAQLSLLATASAIEQRLGHRYRRVSDFEDDLTVPRAAYVSTESTRDAEGGVIGGLLYVGTTAAAGAIVALGGALAMAIAATTLGGGLGGLLGTILARSMSRHHSQYLPEQLDRGGLLLWISTGDGDAEICAAAILEKHSGRDVHIHDSLQPAHATRYDPAASPERGDRSMELADGALSN